MARRHASPHAALRETGAILAQLVDGHGLESVWRTVLANRVRAVGRGSRSLMLEALGDESEFDLDALEGLSLTEVGVLYEYLLAHVDHRDRKSSGQYFTPDDVARFMAERATSAFEPNQRWIDPCCGVGNLSYWLASAHSNPAEFVRENLILVDRDPLALLSARVLLTLEFETDETVDLFARLTERSYHRDAIVDDLPDFDYAILNPPYVIVPADYSFRSASARDLYAYFLERVTILGRGFVAITPQSYTGGRKFKGLRELLLDQVSQFDIFCFDNVPDNIFRGIKFGSTNSNRVNSTRAAVIVASRDGIKRRRITPLLRWRAAERADLFEQAKEQLAPLIEDADSFRKIDKDLVSFYRELEGADRTVGDLLHPSGKYQLSVATTPRYYVSAVERELSRSGVHVLRFRSEADRNLAYLLLNSSIAYWWWRIHDGGITLNRGVLRSVPVPSELVVDEELVGALRESERVSMVVKRNAGRDQENVKHSIDLVMRLNQYIAPRYASALIRVHQNSYIVPSVRDLSLASSL